MEFDYTLTFDLPLDLAWTTVMDIERIAPCMPGAKIESRDGDTYTGRLKVKLGPMEMTYRGDIRFLERDDAAKRALVDAQAKEIKGRGAAKTQVTLTGRDRASGSEIHVHSEFSVSGKAAQFGRGVMEEVGAKLMDDFARRLGEQIAAAPPAADADAVAPVTTTAMPAPDAEPDGARDRDPTPGATSPAATAAPAEDTNTLDLGSAVWAPVLKRMLIPGAIVLVILAVYWLL